LKRGARVFFRSGAIGTPVFVGSVPGFADVLAAIVAASCLVSGDFYSLGQG
jgi:hypothetical protein